MNLPRRLIVVAEGGQFNRTKNYRQVSGPKLGSILGYIFPFYISGKFSGKVSGNNLVLLNLPVGAESRNACPKYYGMNGTSIMICFSRGEVFMREMRDHTVGPRSRCDRQLSQRKGSEQRTTAPLVEISASFRLCRLFKKSIFNSV